MNTLVIYVDSEGEIVQGYKRAGDQVLTDTDQSYLVRAEGAVQLTDLILKEADTLEALYVGRRSPETSTSIEVRADLISRLTGLKHLILENCSISGGTVADCIPNDQLTVLTLNECTGDTTGLTERLQTLQSLVSLELGYLQFNDSIDLDLRQNTRLEEVQLYGIPLSSRPVLSNAVQNVHIYQPTT